MERVTRSSCSRDACTRMYPKAVHQKLIPNDGVRVQAGQRLLALFRRLRKH
jgi:hypothetical protein